MTIEAALNQMLHTWTNGGWVMAALALLAIIAYATAINLLFLTYHRGIKKITDENLRHWVAHPAAAPDQFRELIRYTQDEATSVRAIEGRFREVEAASIPEINRRIVFANVLAISAPLFGLLGTVLGMLLTFKAIGIGGGSTSEVISKGISEALVCTQTGMLVALPGILMVHVVKRWRDEFHSFLLRLEGASLRHFRPEFHGLTRFVQRSEVPSAAPVVSPAPVEAAGIMQPQALSAT
jgi:biopolymer transport protein ExbB